MKKFWESKTFWFNLITLLVTIAIPILNHFGWAEFTPSPEWTTIAGVLVTVVNLVLRLWFTSKKLTR